MLTIADLKAQFTKLADAVAALDLSSYLKELPALAEVVGHPEQAAELRTLIHGALTGDAREIAKGTEGLVNDALAAYYHFPKLTVTAGTGDKDFGNLARGLKNAAEKCKEVSETALATSAPVKTKAKAGVSGAETPANTIDDGTIFAIGQLVMALITFFRSRLTPKPA